LACLSLHFVVVCVRVEKGAEDTVEVEAVLDGQVLEEMMKMEVAGLGVRDDGGG
jgi:hypothetical protein